MQHPAVIELQILCQDESKPITQLLRQALVIATKLDIEDFPHCQNSCHPHLNNPNGEKGDNHGTIQCRTQTGYTKQTFIT